MQLETQNRVLDTKSQKHESNLELLVKSLNSENAELRQKLSDQSAKCEEQALVISALEKKLNAVMRENRELKSGSIA